MTGSKREGLRVSGEAPQAIENNSVEEVPSLLIPLGGRTLLVPTVSVAEMAPYGQVEPEQDAPSWLLGQFAWRNQKVPLLSFEDINGEAKPEMHARSRVAVFNNTGVSDQLPFIGVVTQGIPRLARVVEEEISEIDDAQKKPFERMHVSLAGEAAVIPDIAALEQAYLDYKSRR